MQVPVSLVSLVDTDRQFFKSQCGLPEPWASLRQTPLSHSFCQHVVASGEPLIVEEATRHALVANNLAIRDLNVLAYLGIPLFTPDGQAIGSLCAIDSKSRAWTEKDVEVLSEIADLVMTEIAMRHHLRERKRAEQGLADIAQQLLASNEDLRQFASIASHDLQEPLRKIQTFADRLSSNYSDEIDERGQGYLERMTATSKRMQHLIDALLDLTRVTSQSQPYVPTDLDQVLGEVLCDLGQRIEDAAGRVEIGALHTVVADPHQMQQLLQNLVGNALKFYKEGTPPVVRVHGELCDTSNGEPAMYRFFVEDNGIGFDPTLAERLFQPFVRLHGRHLYEGTGIGMAICKKIVERHGGTISARSTPGEGATFIVTLPVR